MAKTLPAERIDFDAVLSENKLDHQSSGTACVLAEDYKKGVDIILPDIFDLMQQGKNVIFDSCVYHQEALDYLLSKIPDESYVFTFKVSLETSIARDKGRDRTIGEGVAEEVYELVGNKEFGIVIENDNKTIEEAVAEVMTYL